MCQTQTYYFHYQLQYRDKRSIVRMRDKILRILRYAIALLLAPVILVLLLLLVFILLLLVPLTLVLPISPPRMTFSYGKYNNSGDQDAVVALATTINEMSPADVAAMDPPSSYADVAAMDPPPSYADVAAMDPPPSYADVVVAVRRRR